MSISHRTHRLRLVGSPAIEKLQSDRYRITFSLESTSPKEDWYSANKGRIFADYGSLQSTEFAENGCEPRTGEAYPDMRLTEAVSKGDANGGYSLTFVYETLGDTFVAIKDDDTDYEMNGLRRVTRTIIAKAGTDYTGVVGSSSISHQIDDEAAVTCYLGKFKISDTESSRTVEEVYLEAGVLSLKDSFRYGNKVTVYSIEGIKLTQEVARASIPDLPASAKFYGSRISDYEGLQTNVYEYFTGSGVVSTSISTSYNGKLTRTTIVSIDEEPVGPVGSVLIESKAETRDEFILYTYTFVKGQGIVSTNTSSKYDGKLQVVTVTSINQVPVIPVGSVSISAQVREESGYLLYETTYASGSGIIGVSTDTKYNGNLTLTTTTSLNEAPTNITNLIRSESSQSDYGTIYTYTTASGVGEIGSTVESKYNGKLTLTTKTSLNKVPTGVGAVIRADLRDTDYGQIYTYTFADGSGEIGSTEEQKYNGKLTLTTKTSLNQVPSGSGYLFRTDQRETDYGTIYTYTFAEGSGEIGSSEDRKYNGTLILTTKTSLNEAPSGSGYLFKTDQRETDYGTVYTYTYAEGEGKIGESEDYRYQGKLRINNNH